MDVAEEYFNLNLTNLTNNQKINYLEKWYFELPEPRIEIKGSYMIVNAIFTLALLINNLEIAEKWALISCDYDGSRNLAGEGKFNLGEVKFLQGKKDEARKYFTEVYKIAGIRPFKDKNPEYRKLINK